MTKKLFNLPRLEALQIELRGLLAAKEQKEKEIRDLELDMEDVAEDIRQEIEENYHV